jgi:hypothetical protein
MEWRERYGHQYNRTREPAEALAPIEYTPGTRKVYVVDQETGKIRRTFEEAFDIEVFEADNDI